MGKGPLDVLRCVEERGDATTQLDEIFDGDRGECDGGGSLALHHGAGCTFEKVARGLDSSGNESISQSGRGFHDHFRAFPAHGIRREQNACDFTRNHLLDDDGHGERGTRNLVRAAIGDGARRPQAGPTRHDALEHLGIARHVQERLVLTRERKTGQILRVGR